MFVKHGAPVIGRNIHDIGSRSRFHASVVSAVRGSQRLHTKIGDVVLAPGDKLLLVAGALQGLLALMPCGCRGIDCLLA